MSIESFFEVGEIFIAMIGRIGDDTMRMELKGKEIGKISLEGLICTSDLLVGIPPLSFRIRGRSICFLSKIVFIENVPYRKSCFELNSIRLYHPEC